MKGRAYVENPNPVKIRQLQLIGIAFAVVLVLAVIASMVFDIALSELLIPIVLGAIVGGVLVFTVGLRNRGRQNPPE